MEVILLGLNFIMKLLPIYSLIQMVFSLTSHTLSRQQLQRVIFCCMTWIQVNSHTHLTSKYAILIEAKVSKIYAILKRLNCVDNWYRLLTYFLWHSYCERTRRHIHSHHHCWWSRSHLRIRTDILRIRNNGRCADINQTIPVLLTHTFYD